MRRHSRKHHPPDQIIDGKPKWSEIDLIRKSDEPEKKSGELNIDRLNPSRHLIDEIEESCGEKSEETQRVLVNMMSDLKCELVGMNKVFIANDPIFESDYLVTLGDCLLDPEKEKREMEKYLEWENFKVRY